MNAKNMMSAKKDMQTKFGLPKVAEEKKARFNGLLTTTLSLLALLGLNAFNYHSASAKIEYPGIFITDTADRWNSNAGGSSPDEEVGYVVCHGGYLGSPLISNEKSIVDKYLRACTTHQRVGLGKLPIIDVPANTDPDAINYEAYKAEVNGRTYFLCNGFLNSTNWCSFDSEKKAMQLKAKLEKGVEETADENESFQSHTARNQGQQLHSAKRVTEQYDDEDGLEGQDDYASESYDEAPARSHSMSAKKANRPAENDYADEQEDDDYASNSYNQADTRPSLNRSRGLRVRSISQSQSSESSGMEGQPRRLIGRNTSQEAIQEIAGLQGGVKVIPLGGRPSEEIIRDNPGAKVVKITSDDLQALQSGRLSLDQLVASQSSANGLGANTTSINPQSISDLQSKKISLESFINSNQSLLNKAQAIPLNAVPMNTTAQNISQGPSVERKTIAVTESELAAIKNGTLGVEQIANRPDASQAMSYPNSQQGNSLPPVLLQQPASSNLAQNNSTNNQQQSLVVNRNPEPNTPQAPQQQFDPNFQGQPMGAPGQYNQPVISQNIPPQQFDPNFQGQPMGAPGQYNQPVISQNVPQQQFDPNFQGQSMGAPRQYNQPAIGQNIPQQQFDPNFQGQPTGAPGQYNQPVISQNIPPQQFDPNLQGQPMGAPGQYNQAVIGQNIPQQQFDPNFQGQPMFAPGQPIPPQFDPNAAYGPLMTGMPPYDPSMGASYMPYEQYPPMMNASAPYPGGAPVTYATSVIYGTHSNTQYWPGGARPNF